MTRIILLSFFLLIGSTSSSPAPPAPDLADSSGCLATDRKDQGQPCVFPFTDQNGTLHYTCTATGDPYGEEWCATQTDQDHSVIEWGHCSPGCRDSVEVVSMMVVGPTGVGKSSLLNSLLCPAKWTTEFEDCHFRTDNSVGSVTKGIKQVVGPWLGKTEVSVIPMAKVFDTPGLGDSDGVGDTDTLKGIVEIINSESVQAILLVIKATERFSQHIQKQLRTLEYILGPQLWDHVITVFTFWGFATHDVRERIQTCIKERKGQFGGNVPKTRDFCKQFDFQNEKVEEMTKGFMKYLGVEKRFPYAFPHPIFNYNVENERRIFFENAMTIYNNAKTMSRLQCDEQCERRLDIALKSGKRTPFVLGQVLQRFEAGEEIYLECHLYLGLGNSTAGEIRWWHNSSLLQGQDIRERNIKVKDEILLDVIKQSLLIIPNATFDDAGTYKCSTIEKRIQLKSFEVTVKVLPPCKAGYERLADSEECEDVDECSSGIDDCSPDELCFNTVGSWSCCQPGYQLGDDGETCTDIDECQSGPDSVCPQGQSCFNTPGSKVCCKDGLWPNSTDPSQCLDCSLPDHVLNTDTQRCFKCPAGSWPSTEGYDCSPCNLLEGVRYSDDRRTCVHCPPGTTPNEYSTECLDCAGEYNFYTSKLKTRCAVCPGGQGATEDHLGCHRIDGQWESWGSWGQCSKSCIEEDENLGEKYRERECSPAKYGGEDCDRKWYRESQPCAGEGINYSFCPIDGNWNPWSDWGTCSQSCGGGEKTRIRFCNKPRHGGKNCVGKAIDTEACNTETCWGWKDVNQAVNQVNQALETVDKAIKLKKLYDALNPSVGSAEQEEECNTQKCQIRALNPETVTVSSTGGASERWPSVMGVYKITKITHSGRPVWQRTVRVRQSDSQTVRQAYRYLFYNGYEWVVHYKVSNDAAYIKSKKKGQAYIPVRGWQYAGGGWPDDDTLTVTEGDPT